MHSIRWNWYRMQPHRYKMVYDLSSVRINELKLNWMQRKSKVLTLIFGCQAFESFASYHDIFTKYVPDIFTYICVVFSFRALEFVLLVHSLNLDESTFKIHWNTLVQKIVRPIKEWICFFYISFTFGSSWNRFSRALA